MMTDGMMDEMMWAMGVFWLLILALLLLAGAALVKYLFFNKCNVSANAMSRPKGRRMRIVGYMLAALITMGFAAPSFAHHPGKKLDEFMGNREKYFQIVDEQSPSFALQDADGRLVTLADFRDKVVVLFFVYAGCPDVCPLHAERIAQVQDMIAQTPMKDRVLFVTITTDPKNDTGDVMRGYGMAHGLKSDNWVFLTTKPDQPEETTRQLAKKFGHSFTKTKQAYQAHGVVTHVVDRGGRWAANFHGLRFEPVNLVLYLNSLTNTSPKRPEPGMWDRIKGLF